MILFQCNIDVHAKGQTRIHIINLANADAILLESNGRFGMIDSGEDTDYPDGSDPRYPLRSGISKAAGNEEEVIEYLKSAGVTKDNFEFYIGTHPHSDHIGTADDVIREFTPQRVYIMEYADEYIMTEWGLYDNLYVYDQMLEAAQEVGAAIIQNFSVDAPVTPLQSNLQITTPSLPEENQEVDKRAVDVLGKEEIFAQYDLEEDAFDEGRNPEEIPEEGVVVLADEDPNSQGLEAEKNTTGNPVFYLGDMLIEIMNYSDDYKSYPKPDANYFSLGVKVSVNGKSAFLAGDIGAYDGDEVRLAPVIGNVDVLKLGHHGVGTSNTEDFLKSLSPKIAVQTGNYELLPQKTIGVLDDLGTRLYTTATYREGYQATIIDYSEETLSTNLDGSNCFLQRNESPFLTYYENGLKTAYQGFQENEAGKYYFDNQCYALESMWIQIGENADFYYFKDNGIMAQSQWVSNYYVDENGIWIPERKPIKQGWEYASGNWFYYDRNSNKVSGWNFIDDIWYYMEPNGVMVSNQWKWIGGQCYYFSASGALMTEQWISGYYVDKNGVWIPNKVKPQVGWIKNGSWYYIQENGNLAKGWLELGSLWYYFDKENRMITGWQVINGKKYVFKDSGEMLTGWLFDDENWYYFAASGEMTTGWVYTNGEWYYLASDGHMCTEQWIDQTYYVDALGKYNMNYTHPDYGWHKMNDNNYYYDRTGRKVTEWRIIDNSWYYFYYSGIMAADKWVWSDDKCYYLSETGQMLVNQWVLSGGKYYYLAEDGHMLTDTWIGKWYVDKTGAWVE